MKKEYFSSKFNMGPCKKTQHVMLIGNRWKSSKKIVGKSL
jgi:hypothetical protein